MASKTASLSLHKNTIEKRRKHHLARSLTNFCRNMTKCHDVRAFAVVGIGADGKAYCHWDTGAIMPMWGFPETVAAAIRRDMEEAEIEEDWRPALPPGGSR
jgi:hypothetical protein